MPNEPTRSIPIDAIEAWSHGENKLRILMVISSPLDETIRLNTKHEIEDIYRQLSYSKVPAVLVSRTHSPNGRVNQTKPD